MINFFSLLALDLNCDKWAHFILLNMKKDHVVYWTKTTNEHILSLEAINTVSAGEVHFTVI